MKKISALLIISIFIWSVNTTAQVSVPANAGIPANYVGWNALQAFPLTIAHKGNFPMNFQTNGVQRMTIMNTTGFVGIGQGFSAPQSLLHVNDGLGAFLQLTDAATGAGAGNGLRVGVLFQNAYVAQQQSAELFFSTAGLASIRMTIRGTTGATQGFVGVNTTNPQNTFEINSYAASPVPSGLRLTNLPNTSSASTNTTNKILC